MAQDTSKIVPDLNKNKIVTKINSLLDSSQKKIKNEIINKANNLNQNINNGIGNSLKKYSPIEEERPLPYEKLLNKKYTLGRRAYQNTVAQYNYLFYANEELNDLIQKARTKYQEDYSSILSFYDYNLSDISKESIDSIIYRCNANIVLHDLRSNWVDDSYLLLAKAYLFHKNFDTAGSILQFINYAFDEKIDGMDLPIGSNLRQINGKFSIANKATNRIWENENVRNESMVWQARNYLESNSINEGLSLLQLLKGDALFPKKLAPFLDEQLAYAYYLMESYENAAVHLINALPNAIDNYAKSRWYFLIAQMWQKANRIEDAYFWFKKASDYSINPIIGVYAKINMVRIDAKKSNQSWEILANDLFTLSNKEKYSPYADIIYFEMAKLAIQYKSFDKATQWLVTSISKNHINQQQKQQSFELLGDINYQNNNYAIAKIAYDSLNNILKSNPQYETIQLRKKWMATLVEQIQTYQMEDSLQFIYKLPREYQQYRADHFQIRKKEKEKYINQLFSTPIHNGKIKVSNENTSLANSVALTTNAGYDFYFTNTNNIVQGKQQFIQKWGERPNVDMWRRKTSTYMANAVANSSTTHSNSLKKDSVISMITKDVSKDSIQNLKLLSTSSDYINSQIKWNNAALNAAQTLLLKLNDFSKAKPIYQQIIAKNIDSIITERALLDLASQYLHEGSKESADSIIKIITKQFPNGVYLKKKAAYEDKNDISNNALHYYNEFYFLNKIGDWSQMEQKAPLINSSIVSTKWYTPFQFLKVKMYAQQNKDSLAIQLLDSIIARNNNDLLRDKAKNIKNEILGRNKTENYLQSLTLNNVTPDFSINHSTTQDISFKNDSLEQHFIAISFKLIKPSNIIKLQSAWMNLNKSWYPNKQINTSFAPLNNKGNILWMGPFENGYQSIKYWNTYKSQLLQQIDLLIPQQQYEIYIFGKSNISLIKDYDDLSKYKEFMIQHIFTP